MISFVEGIVEEVAADYVVFNVNGIGYQVFVTAATSLSLQPGAQERLHTQYHVREDAHLLYGFKTKNERNLFVRLQNVSGIGPKAALTIVGSAPVGDVVAAIQSEQADFLKKLPGIGAKTAQRIIIELKDKLDDIGIAGTGAAAPVKEPGGKSNRELFDALLSLGYNEKEVRNVMRSLADEIEQGLPLESLIKKALQELFTK
ncbi:Holliday junction branch migration protein RuvA [Effusibacillus dendaii]|uniref:Holliday junction branch migration complex subunit RuvA n=1 Tax=Effusibacillus dendaii TaxID=2743772 RepID=A0A7I8DFN3_9BACL|nr:Holliday junction branch migration protein RuvA [Effusibacillus dendaii]BCJ88122.1 Holliday junction ATP-dependent DNA helicase RuvA [Effusibacillus dendaii]